MVARVSVLTSLLVFTGRDESRLRVVSNEGFRRGMVVEFVGGETALVRGVDRSKDGVPLLLVDRWAKSPRPYQAGSRVSVIAGIRGGVVSDE